MNGMRDWVKLPNAWIEDGGLRDFQWKRGRGADELAALMVLAVIGHHADLQEGIAQLTYDDLHWKATLSRAKIAAGLKILEKRGIVEPRPKGRGSYRLAGYDPHGGWAKLPARRLYRNGSVAAFDHFNLRRPAELNALKLYFLFASRRDRSESLSDVIDSAASQASFCICSRSTRKASRACHSAGVRSISGSGWTSTRRVTSVPPADIVTE